MIRLINTVFLLIISLAVSFGQNERKLVREGVKDYAGNQHAEAEVNFRKALDAKPGLYEAEYDIANSLYKQKKYTESAAEFEKLIQKTEEPQKRADLYHNLGNSQLMAQQFEKGIEAYKNSLRIRPDDEDTRYNLAYALQKMKEKQQEQEKKEQEQEEKKQEQQKEEEKQQDQEEKKQEQQKEEEKQQEQQQQQEGKEQEISKEEMEQMLNAVQNQEKEVKDKADKKKAVARPVATEKDW